jgi:hypothetical protein
MENTEYRLKMSDKYKNRLPDDLNQMVKKLDNESFKFQVGHKNLKAVETLKKAYELLPEPKDQWSYTSSIIGNIAENYYLISFF